MLPVALYGRMLLYVKIYLPNPSKAARPFLLEIRYFGSCGIKAGETTLFYYRHLLCGPSLPLKELKRIKGLKN